MAFDLDLFSRSRPWLYHLTARENLDALRRTGELRCAAKILTDGDRAGEVCVKRAEHLHVYGPWGRISVRDQKPLQEGNVGFEAGWTMDRLVRHLNAHVFFWPSSGGQLSPYGMRHFTRYSSERPILLRLATSLIPSADVRFSRFNSGAPRCVGGRRSPRGSQTYVTADRFPGTPGDVVEVVSVGPVKLPASVEIADDPGGPWNRWA